MNTKTLCSTALALLFLSGAARAQQVELVPVVTGLTNPLFVGNADDGRNRLFIAERGGLIKVLQPGSDTPTVFLDIRSKVLAGGEQGLLGLAFHPLYTSNGRFFVYYTRAGDGAIVIAQYVASPASSNTAGNGETVILTIPHPTNTNHNGGMLAFGREGYLYAGVGDGGGANDVPNNAQNKNVLLGKILRINVDAAGAPYASPIDNPFYGAIDGRDEIFAYGMRNPWRFSFDRGTGQLWVGDVGQGAREEVDTPIANGGNYGWRVFEGFRCTNNDPALCSNPSAYIPPIFDYDHAGGRCSLTGGYVYRGNANSLPQGTYIYGDYCSGEIFAWDGAQQSVLLATTMNISSFGEDEGGELYVVNLNGTVSRIEGSAACTFTVAPLKVTLGTAAATGTVTITTQPGCAWQAKSNATWITITSGASGTGSGTLRYSVPAYVARAKSRTGTIAVAGEKVSIRQTR